MSKYLVFAGYSKKKHVHAARQIKQEGAYELICAYERPPHTDTKIEYLALFDKTFNLMNERERTEYCALKDEVAAITCTQERDMNTYIQLLEMNGFIEAAHTQNYLDITNKYTFKKCVREVYPELVPEVIDLAHIDIVDLDESFLPGVIKPSGLAGSSFVHVVKSKDDVTSFIEKYRHTALGNGSTFFNRNISIILEKFINGPQFSVNAYIDAHKNVTLCPLVRVIPAYQIGIDDTYSALQYTTDELSEDEQADLQKAIEKIVEMFNITSTSAHFDAVLSEGGWKFFEVGLRIGGKRDKLYYLSHGMEHFKNDLNNRLGKKVMLGTQKKVVGIVQIGSEKHGMLEKISFEREITEKPAFFIHEDKLPELPKEVLPVSQGGGTITRHFIVGDDVDDIVEGARRLKAYITFHVS